MTSQNEVSCNRNHAEPGQGFPIRLTERQCQILELLCRGLPNKLIERELNIAPATVKTHVASVLRSLNVDTRLMAVVKAYRLGLVRPDGRFAGWDRRNGVRRTRLQPGESATV